MEQISGKRVSGGVVSCSKAPQFRQQVALVQASKAVVSSGFLADLGHRYHDCERLGFTMDSTYSLRGSFLRSTILDVKAAWNDSELR